MRILDWGLRIWDLWFRRKGKTRPTAPHKMGFDLAYWRSRPDLIEETKRVYQTRWFQEWISVLHHEVPLDSIDGVRAHKRLLRMMELMADSPEEALPELKSSFGAEKEFPDEQS